MARPADLSLPEKTVHVWALDDRSIESASLTLASTLCPDEQQRARAFRHERHRTRFVGRRSLLRWLIGGYLSYQPESLRFGFTQFGRPVLQSPGAERLAFSVSHTDGMTLFAFAWACQLGVDVEHRIDHLGMSGIGRMAFSATEQKMLDAARPDCSASLLRIWTRKEALLKALGTGLAGEPCAYTTEDDSELGEGHWRASHHGAQISGWTFRDLPLGPHFRSALAASLEEEAHVTLQFCSVPNGSQISIGTPLTS